MVNISAAVQFHICATAFYYVSALKPTLHHDLSPSCESCSSHDDRQTNFPLEEAPRFAQSKSKFNVLLYLTNMMFGGQTMYKPQFQTGGCPGWYLNPSMGPAPIDQDFLQTSGWSYDVPGNVIQYQGAAEDVEPAHPFPLFFLYRRTWTKSSLIKRNFFCQSTSMSADIQLNGAEEAGLIFRVIGDWNFWGVLLSRDGKVRLVRVLKGEKKTLKEMPGVVIQPGKWCSVHFQEMIGDIKVSASEFGGVPQDVKWSLKDMEEIEDEDQGAVGLLASKGPAKFRNTQMGEVDWVPNNGGPGALAAAKETEPDNSKGLDFGNAEILKDKLAGWCPPGSLCAGKPYNYQSMPKHA